MEHQPTAIYVHIPFCQRKCLYCDFTSQAGQEALFDPYINALRAEIRRGAMEFPETRIATIYFGGGTPTVLSADQLELILGEIQSRFSVDGDAEISTEANPGSALFRLPSAEGLGRLRSMGFNRISLGIQSLNDSELCSLGRIHNAEEATDGFLAVRAAGFKNVSCDLMYGIPGQTPESWLSTLHGILSLQPEHVSLYSLTVEEGTPFFEMQRSGRLSLPGDEIEAEMYLTAIETLTRAGFEHYEISNFARPGYACRHNMTYWRNEPYFGFGAGAASYLHRTRASNVGDIQAYIRTIKERGTAVDTEEHLIIDREMGETTFLGLRMLRGLDLESFLQRYGESFEERYRDEISDLLGRAMIEIADGRLRLTRIGLMFADDVFQAFIT